MFTVRRASTGADWREATALLYDYVEWVRGWTGVDPVAEQPQLHTELSCLADHFATDDAALYIAAWQAIAVGAVAIRVEPDGSAELKRMYVRPVARGRGIADRLIAAAVAGATERQCHTAWLQTLRGAMDPAIAVYRRNGFAESSTRPVTLSMECAIIMERSLGHSSSTLGVPWSWRRRPPIARATGADCANTAPLASRASPRSHPDV